MGPLQVVGDQVGPRVWLAPQPGAKARVRAVVLRACAGARDDRRRGVGAIDRELCVLLGVAATDTAPTPSACVEDHGPPHLRDDEGRMNKAVDEIGGAC